MPSMIPPISGTGATCTDSQDAPSRSTSSSPDALTPGRVADSDPSHTLGLDGGESARTDGLTAPRSTTRPPTPPRDGFELITHLATALDCGPTSLAEVAAQLRPLVATAFDPRRTGLRRIGEPTERLDPLRLSRPVETMRSEIYQRDGVQYELLYRPGSRTPRHVIIASGAGQLIVSLVDYDLRDASGNSMFGRMQWVRWRNPHKAMISVNRDATGVWLERFTFFNDGAMAAGEHMYRRVFDRGEIPSVQNLTAWVDGREDLVLALPGRDMPWTFGRHNLEPVRPPGYSGPMNFLGLPGPLRIH